MDLDELRKQIDVLDGQLIKLVHRRMEYALRTTKLKAAVHDPVREQQVLEQVRSRARLLLDPDFAARLMTQVIDESKRLQALNPQLVGFQGEHGAYSELAVRSLNPDWVPIPCREFVEVFDAVASGQLDLGVVPVENSLEGAVTQVNDLLIDTPLRIAGEIQVPIHHCLLTVPETDFRDIRVVYSHPHALAQCRGFLSRNNLEARPYYDTSGAAAMLAHERPKAAAAIASQLAAELHGLEIIKERIEDHETNSTRFVVLSRQPASAPGNKCSIAFCVEHRSGALLSVLQLFSEAGLNLTRIESRPLRTQPGRYAFLLDFDGSDQDPRVVDILAQVQKQTPLFRFLGCYQAAQS